MNELKPCPFCGGIAEIKQKGINGLEIKCSDCIAKMTQKVIYKSLEWLKEEMVKDWNNRV